MCCMRLPQCDGGCSLCSTSALHFWQCTELHHETIKLLGNEVDLKCTCVSRCPTWAWVCNLHLVSSHTCTLMLLPLVHFVRCDDACSACILSCTCACVSIQGSVLYSHTSHSSSVSLLSGKTTLTTSLFTNAQLRSYLLQKFGLLESTPCIDTTLVSTKHWLQTSWPESRIHWNQLGVDNVHRLQEPKRFLLGVGVKL